MFRTLNTGFSSFKVEDVFVGEWFCLSRIPLTFSSNTSMYYFVCQFSLPYLDIFRFISIKKILSVKLFTWDLGIVYVMELNFNF